MGSRRQEKVKALLQGAIAKYFNEHKDEWEIDDFISVDDVFLLADLQSADVWISFGPNSGNVDQFEVLQKHLGHLQRWLFGELEMKRVPKIKLHLADPHKQYNLEQIFDTLKGHGQDDRPDQADTGKSD